MPWFNAKKLRKIKCAIAIAYLVKTVRGCRTVCPCFLCDLSMKFLVQYQSATANDVQKIFDDKIALKESNNNSVCCVL